MFSFLTLWVLFNKILPYITSYNKYINEINFENSGLENIQIQF